jgi:hypothetical protein
MKRDAFAMKRDRVEPAEFSSAQHAAQKTKYLDFFASLRSLR